MKHVRVIETHHRTHAVTGAVTIRARDLRTGKGISIGYSYTDSFQEHTDAAKALAHKLSGKALKPIAQSGNGTDGYLFIFNSFSAV
jgi:hypothetical protein